MHDPTAPLWTRAPYVKHAPFTAAPFYELATILGDNTKGTHTQDIAS